MDWQRGNAIKKEVTTVEPIDLKAIRYRIANVVNLELQDCVKQKKFENNPFGKWVLK
tara:strand:- start:82 stop:252 length:171 start_codon:yes stop_codon:yes gene_type:complete